MSKVREKHRFSCGCEWDVIKEDGQIVSILYDPLKAPLTCPKTWDMLCAGKTLGTFQLETRLGQSFAKKLKPTNIQELANLISIIRPGTLDAIVDNKSLTAHFIDRKHGREEATPPHRLLTEVTKDTYGIMIAQEQSMLAAQLIARFNGPESYALIKAIGKKKPELMSELKNKFIQGAIDNQVTREDAEQLFSIIEASQRYSFNFCLSPDTLVETINGKRQTIDEIEIGTQIHTPEGYDYVVNKYENGNNHLYEIILERGDRVICTMAHKFLCDDDIIRPLCLIIQGGYRIYTLDGSQTISEINYEGFKRTLDIEVDNKRHLFFTQGIATSNSHAIEYALDNYIFSAYPKAHFPKAFFTAQLDAAKDFKDINDFINDAMEHNVRVVGPDIRIKNATFIIKNEQIHYGLSKIKHVSSHVVTLLQELHDYSWENILYNYLPKINSQAVEALIKSGALDLVHKSRKTMLHEYKIFKRLSIAQKRSLDKTRTLRDNIINIGNTIRLAKSKKILTDRLNELDNPPFSLEDSVSQICRWEQELLGYSFTYTELDDRNVSISNCTCEDFLEQKFRKNNVIRIAVVLETLREHKIKKQGMNSGELMAFASGSDGSGKLSSIIFFPNTYYDYNTLIFAGNRVILQGRPGKDTAFIVDKVYQL